MNLKPTVAAVLVALAAQPALADRYKGYSYYTPRPAYRVVRVADPGYRGNVVYARVIDVAPIVRHVTVADYSFYWSWVLFVAGTGLAFGILVLMD